MDLLAPLHALTEQPIDPLDALETLAKRPTPEPKPVEDGDDDFWGPRLATKEDYLPGGELYELGDTVVPEALVRKQAEAVEAHRNR